jgi:hypothetical protein
MTLDLRQGRDHNLPEIPLILSVESNYCSFVRSNNGLARSDDTVIRLGRQLVGQKEQNQTALQEILLWVSYAPFISTCGAASAMIANAKLPDKLKTYHSK